MFRSRYSSIKVDGKTYKLKGFEKSWLMRFNKANINILSLKGVKMHPSKKHKTLIYLSPTKTTARGFITNFKKIRGKNIFTQRGINNRLVVDSRKIGFVSGYI